MEVMIIAMMLTEVDACMQPVDVGPCKEAHMGAIFMMLTVVYVRSLCTEAVAVISTDLISLR